MIVDRLSKRMYTADLSGSGARVAGGRWNSPGVAMLYTSDSRALCTAEIAVHTGLGLLPADYQLVTIMIPDNLPISVIDPEKLPKDWRSFPYAPFTRLIGDQFVKEKRFLVLKVPSAVVPGDFNYLINPAHPMMNQVTIVRTEDFGFDERMFL
ncbi:MAG: RES family NAD+ phosphorylase [Bacteroidia bacterium]|nr:RES family NAD+ phosphorylase [Bacteroidia bacterium]